MLGKMSPLSFRVYGSPAAPAHPSGEPARASGDSAASGEPAQRPTLVLLHAYPLDSRMWDEVIPHLRAEDPDRPILTIDAPGFGDSPPGPEVAAALGRGGDPSLETFADAIEATLEELGIERIVLVGLSLGGYAALAYAEKHPDRIAGIGLLDTKAEADDEPARKVRLSTAAKVTEEGTGAIEGSLEVVLGPTSLAERPGVVADLREQILAAPPEAVAWIQRAMAARPDRLEALRGVAIPALVLRGAEDALSPRDSAEAMAAALGGIDVVTLDGVGHMSANEAPTEVARAVADLHARVAPAT